MEESPRWSEVSSLQATLFPGHQQYTVAAPTDPDNRGLYINTKMDSSLQSLYARQENFNKEARRASVQLSPTGPTSYSPLLVTPTSNDQPRPASRSLSFSYQNVHPLDNTVPTTSSWTPGVASASVPGNFGWQTTAMMPMSSYQPQQQPQQQQQGLPDSRKGSSGSQFSHYLNQFPQSRSGSFVASNASPAYSESDVTSPSISTVTSGPSPVGVTLRPLTAFSREGSTPGGAWVSEMPATSGYNVMQDMVFPEKSKGKGKGRATVKDEIEVEALFGYHSLTDRPSRPALPTRKSDSVIIGHRTKASTVSQAGGSGSSGAGASGSTGDNGKRKGKGVQRSASTSSGSGGFGGASNNGGGKKKGKDDDGKDKKGKEKVVKKKAVKACVHCQKAHLTCEDVRPCSRCVKKGLADMCVDGARKKAKYLMDDGEKAIAAAAPAPIQHDRRASSASSYGQDRGASTSVGPLASPLSPESALPQLPPQQQLPMLYREESSQSQMQQPIQQRQQQQQPIIPSGMPIEDIYAIAGDYLHDTDPIFNLNFDPTYPFDSQAANQEYTMLSSLFADQAGNVSTPTYSQGQSSRIEPPGLSQPIFQLNQPVWPDESREASGSGANQMDVDQNAGLYPLGIPESSQMGALNNQAQGSTTMNNNNMNSAIQTYPPSDPRNPFGDDHRPVSAPPPAGSSNFGANSRVNASEVYSQVTRPYDYTEGYHFLMRYLTRNFEQSDVLKVVKSLAAYRPSLIALQMHLIEEDFIFLERSFQRTLVELEKLISYSGTPTAVWRRTGEICLVGEEFCQMMEYSKSDLLEKKTFIYELFDKPSVVSYFDSFSSHAFENSTQNFFLQCTLVTRTGKQLPCSGCFTLRRDVFDLPSIIIGQLLPSNV